MITGHYLNVIVQEFIQCHINGHLLVVTLGAPVKCIVSFENLYCKMLIEFCYVFMCKTVSLSHKSVDLPCSFLSIYCPLCRAEKKKSTATKVLH